MRLSKRILAEYNLETQPNSWNEEAFKNYDYIGFHSPKLYDQCDHERYDNNSYSIFNTLTTPADVNDSLLSQRTKNREIIIDQFEDLL